MALLKVSAIAVSACALLAPFVTSAAELTTGETKMVLGVQAGGVFGNSNVRQTHNVQPITANNTLGGQGFAGGVLAGVEHATKGDLYLATDLSYNWGGATAKMSQAPVATTAEAQRLTQNGSYGLDFKLGWNHKSVVPYVIVGVARSKFKLETLEAGGATTTQQRKTLTGVNLGLGALFPVTKCFSLVAQVTYSMYAGKINVNDTSANVTTTAKPRTNTFMVQARWSI